MADEDSNDVGTPGLDVALDQPERARVVVEVMSHDSAGHLKAATCERDDGEHQEDREKAHLRQDYHGIARGHPTPPDWAIWTC